MLIQPTYPDDIPSLYFTYTVADDYSNTRFDTATIDDAGKERGYYTAAYLVGRTLHGVYKTKDIYGYLDSDKIQQQFWGHYQRSNIKWEIWWPRIPAKKIMNAKVFTSEEYDGLFWRKKSFDPCIPILYDMGIIPTSQELIRRSLSHL